MAGGTGVVRVGKRGLIWGVWCDEAGAQAALAIRE